MTSDLATEIIIRVRRLLDGLLATVVRGRLPSVPPLGQRLFTRYGDWVDGLFSRLHVPLPSAILFSRNSSPWFLPLSYAWFDRRWIDSRKRSRPFWRQSGNQKDEDRQMPAVPEYSFEEETGEDMTSQLQSTQSKPAADIILNLPILRTLPTGNTEFTRAGQLAGNIRPLGIPESGTLQARNSKFNRPEQLAKEIALRFELLTDKGSPTPWHMPFEASDLLYYPGPVTNSNLMDKARHIIAHGRPSHLEETFYPSGAVDLSRPRLGLTSGQHIGAVPMPLSREPSVTGRTPIQAVSPFVLVSDVMNRDSEPSGVLSIMPSGQPVNETRIASLPRSSESPFMRSNNIQATKAFPRLQSLFDTSLSAPSTNLKGKASVVSTSYLFEPPQVASDAVPADKADTTRVSYSEEPPLAGPDETPDITGVAGQYFEKLAPRPALDNTWGSRQTSLWHWSAGYTPPSLTEKAIGQETGGSLQAVASMTKNSSFGGYSGGTEVGLALAPIARQPDSVPAATSSAVGAGQERASEATREATPAFAPESLASEVYSILKRRLIVEKERTT